MLTYVLTGSMTIQLLYNASFAIKHILLLNEPLIEFSFMIAAYTLLSKKSSKLLQIDHYQDNQCHYLFTFSLFSK